MEILLTVAVVLLVAIVGVYFWRRHVSKTCGRDAVVSDPPHPPCLTLAAGDAESDGKQTDEKESKAAESGKQRDEGDAAVWAKATVIDRSVHSDNRWILVFPASHLV